MNTIEIACCGRIARDAEIKHSQSGKPWCRVSVGVGSDENTQWIGVTLFGTMAAEMAPRLTKGTRVYVEGRDLRLDSYTTQAGEQRHGLKAIATRVDVLGEIGKRRPPKPKGADGELPARAAPVSGPGDWQRPLDDNIPFAPEWR